MICLGILSVQEETKERSKGRIRVQERERFVGKCPVVVAELSITPAELQRMKPRQKRRIFRKGERFLKRLGADFVVPTSVWNEYFGLGAGFVEMALAAEDLPEACKEILFQHKEFPRGRTGWVLDETCSPVCLPLLEIMSRKVQYLGLVTRDRQKAEELEEILCEEYGVNLEIRPFLPLQAREASVLVNVNTGEILLDGNVALNGKKMALEIKEYSVHQAKYVKMYPELREALAFHSWCKRKSG